MALNIKTSKKTHPALDSIFLLVVPAIAAYITLALPLNLLVSTILFFGPPALYISWQRKDIVLRSLVYATTVSVISILTDYLAEQDQSWVSTSMFSFRLAGVVPIEALIWMFLFTYLIVVYYLYYFDFTNHKVIGKRMSYVFFAALAVLIWLIFIIITDTHFAIEYFYIKFGLPFLFIPLLVFIIIYPQYLRAFIKITPYFFVMGLINLLVSLEKGHWSYPGNNFVGWVQLGSYRFPIEELVFWIILYAPFLISQFELFNNDRFNFKSSWLFNYK